jgi:integrase
MATLQFRRSESKWLNREGQPVLEPTLIFHDLRRSAVRNLVAAGVDQTVAMKITGHRTVSVFQRYRIVSDADVRVALERTEAASKSASARNVVPMRPSAHEAAG